MGRRMGMDKYDFLVIESDQVRLGAMLSALQFLGYQPQDGALCASADVATHAWRGVFVGTVAVPAEAERQLALLGDAAAHVPMLVAGDSAWAARFASAASTFATRSTTIDFPLRYEQMAEALGSVSGRAAEI